MTSRRSVAAEVAADFVTRYPDEAARVLERQSGHQIAVELDAVPAPQAAAVVGRLTAQLGAELLETLPLERAAPLVELIEPEPAAAMLAWMAAEARETLLRAIGAGAARELRDLASYPRDTAGALMDSRAISVRQDATAAAALARLRASRAHAAHEVFTVDADGRLAGMVAVRDLALAEPTTPLGALETRSPFRVSAMATRDDMLEELAGRRIASLPVVDANGRLVGVVRPEKLVAVAQEEAGADMQAMVGASREERALSPVTFAVRQRLPWLQINLATAFLASAVVGLFEATIARFTALAVLLPVVAGQSGNTGAQALAVTMRGLALREVRVRHWWRIAVKETGVAAINGCAVAVTTAAGVYLWSRSAGLALVIGLAMTISMLAAGLAGAVIPVVLTASGQDPAQSSSIVLTTVTDVVGFFSFLGIATLLASML